MIQKSHSWVYIQKIESILSKKYLHLSLYSCTFHNSKSVHHKMNEQGIYDICRYVNVYACISYNEIEKINSCLYHHGLKYIFFSNTVLSNLILCLFQGDGIYLIKSYHLKL